MTTVLRLNQKVCIKPDLEEDTAEAIGNIHENEDVFARIDILGLRGVIGEGIAVRIEEGKAAMVLVDYGNAEETAKGFDEEEGMAYYCLIPVQHLIILDADTRL